VSPQLHRYENGIGFIRFSIGNGYFEIVEIHALQSESDLVRLDSIAKLDGVDPRQVNDCIGASRICRSRIAAIEDVDIISCTAIQFVAARAPDKDISIGSAVQRVCTRRSQIWYLATRNI
jgi:hypothetical protein